MHVRNERPSIISARHASYYERCLPLTASSIAAQSASTAPTAKGSAGPIASQSRPAPAEAGRMATATAA